MWNERGWGPAVSFVPTLNADRAVGLYRDVLGFELLEQNPGAAVFDSGGTTLRVTVVAKLKPQPFTILGWAVDDIAAEIGVLVARGVVFKHYKGSGQTPEGIWTSPGGAKVAWFRDPDGNILSLSQNPPIELAQIERDVFDQ